MVVENRRNNQSMLASCILQCGNLCSASDMVDKITLKKWKIIGEQEKNGLVQIDNFKSVCTTVEWKLGSTGFFMHDSCYIKLDSLRKLTQAEKRKEKQLQNVVAKNKSSYNNRATATDDNFSPP